MAAFDMQSSAMINAQQQQMQQMQQMNSLRNQQMLMQAQMKLENEAVQRRIAQMQSGFSGPRFQDSFQSQGYGNSYSNGAAPWRNDMAQWQRPERTVIGGNHTGDRGNDNVLVFDFNGDGRYDAGDVQATTNMMKAVSGEVDFNRDGVIDMGERMQAAALRDRYAQMDGDRDGVLNSNEMHRNGARVWTDHSRGGRISHDELSSVYNMPNPNGFGTRPLEGVDFFNRRALTNQNWDFGGGNYGSGGGFQPNYGFASGNGFPPGYDAYGPAYR